MSEDRQATARGRGKGTHACTHAGSARRTPTKLVAILYIVDFFMVLAALPDLAFGTQWAETTGRRVYGERKHSGSMQMAGATQGAALKRSSLAKVQLEAKT